MVTIMTLPFQSVLLFDAISRSLYRLVISKRRLLEWVSSAEEERKNEQGGSPPLLGMYGGYALVLLFLAAIFLNEMGSHRSLELHLSLAGFVHLLLSGG